MENLDVNLRKKTLYLEGSRKYWWKIEHKSSSSSEDAIDTRIWYADSKEHGYVDGDKMKISEIRQLEERQGGEPIDWTPAKLRLTNSEKLAHLNKLVDRAEKEQRKQEGKKTKAANDVPIDRQDKVHSNPESEEGRSIKPPTFERIAKNKLKSGKLIWHRNEDSSWFRIRSLHSKKGKRVPKKDWETLDQILSELGDPIPDETPNTSSKQKNPKRPTFAERNKHGGLIIHSLADSRYYTRFDIRKSKKYPKGFTFRMGRGKYYIQETLDRENLAAIEKEISWVLRS